MGGGQKRGRTQRKHFKQNRDNVWKHGSGAAKKSRPEDPSDSNPNPSWQPFATQNPGFEEYYKEQGIVPEDEWEEFISVLRKPLPAAFRINSSGQFFRDILSQLENDFMKSLDTETEIENEIEAIRPLPWYPGKLAWHLNYSRMQLRKNQTLERFHDFLKQENEVGNITRQEAVSMVPPLFLDVRPEHHILDMCAAPGSKTFQLLEMIHQLDKPGSLPIGLVVANDVDVQRCNLLIHQTKRMCSANLLVTNHEAQHFPTCSLTTSCPEVTKGEKEATKNILQFDRVLCDVPCSGDGTLRKAPDIWRKWNAGMGNGLHRLQVEIAMRGIALLKVGSRMVYSTCSMNPVENEAVVAEILRRSGGAVELLDVSNELPDLVRRPGLRTWKVRDRGLWLASYCDVPNYRRSVITPSMFPSGQCSEDDPIQHDRVQKGIKTVDSHVEGEKSTCLEMKHPSNSYINDEFGCNNLENTVASGGVKESAGMIRELPSKIKSAQEVDGEITVEVSSYPLDHCLRILPHDQNSGAFFIAVLKKISSLQENHTNQSNKRRWNAPVDVNGKLGGETMSETRSSEAAPEQDHCSLAEESLNSSHINDQSSVKAAEVGETLQLDDLSCQNNELEEVEPCGDGESEKGQRGKLQIQGKWKGVDPVVFFREEEIINSIRSYYGISESFSLDGRLVTRNKDANHVKRIYYISQSVHDILQLNFQVGQRLKIASLGLKTFERQTSKDGTALCSFRLSSEGLPLLLPYITKQILCASLVDFQHLLQYRVVKFADFVDANLGEKASNLMPGCCVVTLNEGNQATDKVPVDASTIAIVCWKGKTNLSIMVSQLDAQELCERLSVRFGVKKDNTPAGSTNPNCEAENINTSEDIQKIDDFGSGNDNPVEEAQH